MTSQDYTHPKPISLYARLLMWLMWRLNIKRELAQWFTRPKIKQAPASPPWLYKALCRHAYTQEESQHRGRAVWTLTPNASTESSNRKTIFYLHGGAYLYNITSYHWRFLSRLCHHTQARIIVPDYPLAPTARCAEVYDFLESLYDDRLNESQEGEIIIMGDSAGGGLALGLAQRLKERLTEKLNRRPNESSTSQPSRVILLAPWLDVTLQHPEVRSVEEEDPMLDSVALIKAGEAYRGDLDARAPRVSPLYGEMSSLGRISIFVSTRDLLWPDCRELHHALQRQQIEHDYFEYPQLFHVWMMVVSLPESRLAMRQIVDVILE